jgi:hypothetical protein
VLDEPEKTGSPKSRIDKLDVSNSRHISAPSASSFDIRK